MQLTLNCEGEVKKISVIKNKIVKNLRLKFFYSKVENISDFWKWLLHYISIIQKLMEDDFSTNSLILHVKQEIFFFWKINQKINHT